MMSMQVPAGQAAAPGMVHHKVHDVDWTGLPLLPVERPAGAPAAPAVHGGDPEPRRGRGTGRPPVGATTTPAYAEELLASARDGLRSAPSPPGDLYQPAPNADPSGGGPYDDADVSDEFYWAAAELYLTTGEQQFEDAVLARPLHTARHLVAPAG